MVRPSENWERLVRATLQREKLRRAGHGHERTPSGIAGAVPASLTRETNIDLILQAADEIQSEDPNVARILCEQAYTMAQNLDPNSDGRGVLQFKTGLMSVIKQKLAKRDGARIDRNRDVERLWEFYQLYKRRHSLDDIQKLRESGISRANLGDLELRSSEMKKVFATLRALVEVMEALSKDTAPDGVGRLIVEEMQRGFPEEREQRLCTGEKIQSCKGEKGADAISPFRTLRRIEVETEKTDPISDSESDFQREKQIQIFQRETEKQISENRQRSDFRRGILAKGKRN